MNEKTYACAASNLIIFAIFTGTTIVVVTIAGHRAVRPDFNVVTSVFGTVGHVFVPNNITGIISSVLRCGPPGVVIITGVAIIMIPVIRKNHVPVDRVREGTKRFVAFL